MGVPSNRNRVSASEVACLAVGYRSEGAARRKSRRLLVVVDRDPDGRRYRGDSGLSSAGLVQRAVYRSRWASSEWRRRGSVFDVEGVGGAQPGVEGVDDRAWVAARAGEGAAGAHGAHRPTRPDLDRYQRILGGMPRHWGRFSAGLSSVRLATTSGGAITRGFSCRN